MKQKSDCRKFEQCDLIVANFSCNDKAISDVVHNCLFYLYGDDCAGWLERAYGRKPPGLTDRHNAYHAFHDACMSLEFAIQQKRFHIANVPNACRSYVYRAAKYCYFRLQRNNKKNEGHIELSSSEDSALYPKAEFLFPLEWEQRRNKILSLINTMEAKCREILLLRYTAHLPINEIAVKTGLDRKQVTKRLYNCKEKLKKLIPDSFNENY